jgi:spermidine synthase
MMHFCRDLFATVEYANMSIPTYPAGQIGFVICTTAREDGNSAGVREPKREFTHPALKYYNGDVHKAAFVLPEFARKELGQ